MRRVRAGLVFGRPGATFRASRRRMGHAPRRMPARSTGRAHLTPDSDSRNRHFGKFLKAVSMNPLNCGIPHASHRRFLRCRRTPTAGHSSISRPRRRRRHNRLNSAYEYSFVRRRPAASQAARSGARPGCRIAASRSHHLRRAVREARLPQQVGPEEGARGLQVRRPGAPGAAARQRHSRTSRTRSRSPAWWPTGSSTRRR